MFSRVQTTICAGCACLVFLIACGEAVVPQSHQEPALRIGLRRDVDSLNPYLSTSLEGEILAMRLFPQLFRESGDTLAGLSRLEPNLVKSYTFSNQGRELELELKPGLLWSDGHPVTTADVAFSLTTQQDKTVAWFSSGSKTRIASWNLIDDRRMTVQFSAATATNLMDLNEGFIIPQHYFGAVPYEKWANRNWEQDLVVFGPYRLATHSPGHYLRLERVDQRGPDLIFRMARDPETHYQWIKSDQIDYSWSIPRERVADIAPPLSLTAYPNHQFAYLVWNALDPGQVPDAGFETPESLRKALESKPHPIFRDRNTRIALECALDRQALLDSVLNGFGSIPSSPWSVGRAFHQASVQPRPFDSKLAAQLLAQSGWVRQDDGLKRDGEQLQFRILCNAGSPMREHYLYAAQRQLQRLGMTVELEFVEAGLYWDRLARREFDAAFVMFRRENRPDLAELFHGRSALSQGLNYASWGGADSFIEQVEGALDFEQVVEPLQQAETVFWEQAPVCILFEARQIAVYGPRIGFIDADYLDPLNGVESWQ